MAVPEPITHVPSPEKYLLRCLAPVILQHQPRISPSSVISPAVPNMAKNFFRLEEDDKGRWFFIDPAGKPFPSIGLNHADESNLRYDFNLPIWECKYGSRDSWIKTGVVKDYQEFGFNTIGWTQEYVGGDWGAALDWYGEPIDLQHSISPWSARRIEKCWHAICCSAACHRDRGTGMGIQSSTMYFRIRSRIGVDTLLVVYARNTRIAPICWVTTFVDIPAWIRHASGADFPQSKALNEEERAKKIGEIAERYYSTIVKAIKEQDPNHLILGDRYNGNKGIPEPVLHAMSNYVDVLSVQYFVEAPTAEARKKMRDDLDMWSKKSWGKPVLLADIGNFYPTEKNPDRTSAIIGGQKERGEDYVASITGVLNEKWFLGWHWYSYVANTARGWG